MKRKVLFIGLGVVLLVGGYLLVTRAGLIGEATELIRRGGEVQLREELRSPGNGARVLVIALDGVGRSTLLAVLEEGRMRRLAALLGRRGVEGIYEHAYAAPDVLSVLPSTTMAAWASIFTGEPPARTGVTGNEWFDRLSMRFFAPAPVSVSGYEHTLAMLTDGFVGNAIAGPTLFERADVRSYVSLAPVYRGADLFTLPDPDLVVDLFGALAEGVAGDDSVEREAYASLEIAAVDNVLETIDRHGVADLQVVYFPAVDLFTHATNDPLRKQQDYLAEVVDPQLGRIFDLYARLGALDSTYIVIVSDHGHTPVLNDDRHALEPAGEDEPSAVLESAGFRLRPLVLEPAEDEQDFQAAVAYQGAVAYVYLADRSTCLALGQRCDWRRPARLEEDVLPVARAFEAANRIGKAAPALMGTLDLILVRARDPALGHRTEVFHDDQLVPLSDYLVATPRPDLLRFRERLQGLLEGPFGERAGDILLFAHSGDHRAIEDRFYFSSMYRSWHGSAHAQDSEIPLVVARSSMSGHHIRDVARAALSAAPSQLDFTPLVLTLLGR